MRPTIVHRGIVALAIVTSLAFAGARPAAAREVSVANRINHLWSAIAGAPGAAAGLWDNWHKLTGWLGGGAQTKTVTAPPPSSPDKGWGLDPNGNSWSTTNPASTPH